MMCMKKLLFVIAFFCLINTAFAESTNFTNNYFDFNYDSTWNFIEPSESNAISSDKSVAFESADGKTLVILIVLSANDYAALGKIENVPQLKVNKQENSSLFGIPGKKYYFTADIDDGKLNGEVTISEVKGAYFYKLLLLSNSENYSTFTIQNNMGVEIPNSDAQSGNFFSGIIDWIMSILKWVLSLIGIN